MTNGDSLNGRRQLDRRSFFKIGAAAVAASSTAWTSPVLAGTGSRVLTVFETHRQELLRGEYWRDGWYNPDVLGQFDWLLRDWRTDQTTRMDPALLDILHAIQQRIGASEPLNIICGYRSPQTNAMLASTRRGVASNSLHMYGRAVDIRLPGYSTRGLRDVAVSLEAGGVGYYRGSDFVHVDTGEVRTWG